LIGEKIYVFWVDLRYKLGNQKIGSTAGFSGMTGIPSYLYYLYHEYLTVHPGSALVNWIMVLSMYGTYLKHRQCLYQLISITTHFNNKQTLIALDI